MDGAVGETPDWYLIIRAARYLGVAPWDLLERSSLWYGWALAAEWAETNAAEDKRRMQGDS